MAHEKDASALSGWLVVFTVLLVGAATVWTMANFDADPVGEGLDWIKAVGVVVLVLAGASLAGLTVVNPNEASVVTLFGVYKGTIKRSGFWWVNPLTTRRKLSLRVRNFESTKLKVNERDGNPIEIATVVVWRIVETFEAVFNVDDYENFVHVQSEAAVRNLATTYPYDSHEDAQSVAAPRRPAAKSPIACATKCRSGSRKPASRSSRRASATSRTRRKSRERCCGASRPRR